MDIHHYDAIGGFSTCPYRYRDFANYRRTTFPMMMSSIRLCICLTLTLVARYVRIRVWVHVRVLF